MRYGFYVEDTLEMNRQGGKGEESRFSLDIPYGRSLWCTFHVQLVDSSCQSIG